MAMIKVDENRCKGCKLCVVTCPRKILEMSKELNANGDMYCVQASRSKSYWMCFLRDDLSGRGNRGFK